MPPPGYIPGIPNSAIGVPLALGSAIMSDEADPRWESPGRPAFGTHSEGWGNYLQHMRDHPEELETELPDGRIMNLGEAIRDGWIGPNDPNYRPEVAALPQFRPGAAGVYHGEKRMRPVSQVQQAVQNLSNAQNRTAHVNTRRPSPEKQPDEEFEPLPEAPSGATWDVLARHGRFQRAQKLAHRGYEPLPSTIAPLTDLQQKARQKASLLADAKHDNYDLAEKELKGTMGKSSHNKVQPMLKAATREFTSPEDEPMLSHFDEAAMNLSRRMRREGEDFFNREIAPKTNYAYIQSGLWTSPLRHKAQAHARAEIEKKILDQEAKLALESKHAGLKELGSHKQRNLEAAKEAGNLLEREKESANLGAQNLSKIESQKGIHGALDLEMMNQMGRQHQAEEERGLLEDKEQARAEQMHPHQQMALQSAHEQGSTLPVEFPNARKEQPMAPNHAMNLAGVTALMAPHILGTEQKKYAAGGPVLPDVPMTPEMAYQMQLANEMRQPQSNPHGAGFHELGAHLLASQGKNPYQAFGEGMQKYGAAVNDAKASHQKQRERAANIMQKIQASRLDQQQILMNYGHKEKELQESKRVNTAQIGSHNAHAKLFNAQAKQLEEPAFLGAGDGKGGARFIPKGMTESAEYKQQIKDNSEAEKAAVGRQDAIINADQTINSMESAIKGGVGQTGPWVSILGDQLTTGFDSEKQANRRLFEASTVKELVTNLEKMKGVQSDQDMAIIRRSIPSLNDKPETIQKFLDQYKAVVNRAKQMEKFVQNEMKQGKSRLEAEAMARNMAMESPLFKNQKMETAEQKQSKETEQPKLLSAIEQKMKERNLPLS